MRRATSRAECSITSRRFSTGISSQTLRRSSSSSKGRSLCRAMDTSLCSFRVPIPSATDTGQTGQGPRRLEARDTVRLCDAMRHRSITITAPLPLSARLTPRGPGGHRLEPHLPLSTVRSGATQKRFEHRDQLTHSVNREDTGTIVPVPRCTPIQVGPLARNDGAIPVRQHDSQAPFGSSSLRSPCHLQRLPMQGMMWSSDRDAVHCAARVVCSL